MDKLIELKAQVYDLLAQKQFIEQQINQINQLIIAEAQRVEAEKAKPQSDEN